MAKSKFFRVAVEGATTDGREITRDWIEQMAASYQPATYTARVNMEHIRGFSPDKPFNAYGDIEAVEVRDVELTIDGKPQKRRALYARINPTDELVAVTNRRQKQFTSIEVSPNFAGTGKAYLMGLAVTDSPASLGTELLKFASTAKDNPLAARKQNAENLFTAAAETVIEFEGEAKETPSLADQLVAGFAKLFSDKSAAETKAEVKPEPKAEPADVAGFAALFTGMTAEVTKLAKGVDQNNRALESRFAALEAKVEKAASAIEKTENHAGRRPLATGGGGGNVTLTDC